MKKNTPIKPELWISEIHKHTEINIKRTILCRKLTPFRSPLSNKVKITPIRLCTLTNAIERQARTKLYFSSKDESTILYPDSSYESSVSTTKNSGMNGIDSGI